MSAGVEMLSDRRKPTKESPVPGRRVLLILSEALDTGSDSPLGEVLRRAQLENVTIFSVGLSTTRAELQAKPRDNAPVPITPPGTYGMPGPSWHRSHARRWQQLRPRSDRTRASACRAHKKRRYATFPGSRRSRHWRRLLLHLQRPLHRKRHRRNRRRTPLSIHDQLCAKIPLRPSCPTLATTKFPYPWSRTNPKAKKSPPAPATTFLLRPRNHLILCHRLRCLHHVDPFNRRIFAMISRSQFLGNRRWKI